MSQGLIIFKKLPFTGSRIRQELIVASQSTVFLWALETWGVSRSGIILGPGDAWVHLVAIRISPRVKNSKILSQVFACFQRLPELFFELLSAKTWSRFLEYPQQLLVFSVDRLLLQIDFLNELGLMFGELLVFRISLSEVLLKYWVVPLFNAH